MAARHEQIFESLREDVLDRLMEVRSGIDLAYAGIPERFVRPQFDVVLGKMGSFLRTGEVDRYREFARRWVAMRMGEGFAPESLLHSVASIGDMVVRVARSRLGAAREADEFVREVSRMSFWAARVLVEILAEELASRELQGAGRG